MAVPGLLKPSLQGIPPKPGCYLMKDKAGKVIYVGKAVNLRSRVRSYFHASSGDQPKIAELIRHIVDIEWIVVGSELEALILEMNLIKRYRPKYNVHLKDDKRYPYIRVHWEDPFPKVTFTRRLSTTGSQYFGPYTSAWAVHQTLDILRKIFPYLTCDRVITGEDKRACLYFDIKLCAGPCIGAIDQGTYRAMIGDLCRFLRGHTDAILDRLKGEMEQASQVLDFEKAAVIRDQLNAIEKVVEGHKLISPQMVDSDVIAFARDDRNACVQVFFIRAGKLIGREYFLLDGIDQAEDQELVEAFLKQFYTNATFIPQNVLLPTDIEEAQIIEEWLNQRCEGKKVKLLVPRRGTKRDLIQLAAENASETLTSLRAQWEADRSRHVQALAELQSALDIEQPLNRIECYDISNLQGTAAAGSMVVFEQGTPSKNIYRKFTIKTVEGQDDFASMEEVLSRRFRRWELANEEAQKPGGKLDPAFGMLPNLLIVDGGKGQLSRAMEVIDQYGLGTMFAVIGLAKKHEELYLPDRTDPVILPGQSQALFLVQRIRDEAHRFALKQHRTQRQKKGVASSLDSISGIGPARRKALLKSFGDIESIRNAKVEELASVPGITRSLAERVKAEL
ncbi:MAG: excinuclease ABC subunit C [Chloroflexi bacterium RBG_16_48_8]|nr:MAG: excinuclease ABC subunit C [Chloroflexi bacterium RBG_16_48_8]